MILDRNYEDIYVCMKRTSFEQIFPAYINKSPKWKT